MAKLRIRVGHVELSFEGSEEYIRDEAVGVMEQLVQLGGNIPLVPAPPASPTGSPPPAVNGGSSQPTPGTSPAPFEATTDPVAVFAAELSVDLVHLVSACAPSDEEPFLHIDRHYWAELKEHTPKTGVNAIPPGTLGATLLALWFNHLHRGAPTVDQVRAVLTASNLDDSTVPRAVNNCEWLQLRGENVIVKPAEIKRAIELAAAFCEKRAPRAIKPARGTES